MGAVSTRRGGDKDRPAEPSRIDAPGYDMVVDLGPKRMVAAVRQWPDVTEIWRIAIRWWPYLIASVPTFICRVTGPACGALRAAPVAARWSGNFLPHCPA
jgi:hypothetical protein